MKIQISTKTLADALTEVMPFASQKSPVAILKYAKITTKGNRVKIEANDAQSSIRKYVEAAEIDQDGSFLIDIVDVSALVNRCKGDEITLTIDNDTLTVKHSKGSAEFQVMRVDEYPNFDMPADDVTEITLPGTTFSECIAVAKNFVGTDELRPQMKAIYAYVKDGEFGYCATDTRKMVNDHNPVEGADGIDAGWYIEAFAFSALSKASNTAEDVVVKVTPTHVSYRFGNTIIQTLQTKGKFPDFNRVIPTSWAMECGIDKDDILDSLNRAVLTCEKSRLVKLDISQMDMTISAENPTKLKKSSEQLQHNGCNGEIKIGMQADYLMTCVGVCRSSEVALRLTDSSRPMLIHQDAKPNMVILLMPMTIND